MNRKVIDDLKRFTYHSNPIFPIDYYSVKIHPQNIPATLDKLKAIMVVNDENEPFEYHFLDDQLALFYIEDQRSQTILGLGGNCQRRDCMPWPPRACHIFRPTKGIVGC
jgi:hypothetical protein